MQQNINRQSLWQRVRIRLGIILIVTCLVVSLVLVIRFVILPNNSEHDIDEVLNNKTTKDNDSNRSTTEASTTYLPNEITSLFNDSEPDISSTSSMNRWIVDSYLIETRDYLRAVIMKNDEILVSGAAMFMVGSALFYSSSCEIYSSLNRRWKAVANMQTPRRGHTLTTLQDGKSVLAVGDTFYVDTYTAEIYDLETNRWTFVPSIMSTGRFSHTATLRENGQVLIVGGKNIFVLGSINSHTQLYDPSLNTFITTDNLNTARFDHTATLLNDTMSVLVIGGKYTEEDVTSTAEIYEADFWSYTKSDMIVAREKHAAVLLPDGNVLVAGGSDKDGIALSSVEIYNSTTRTFSLTQPMACARSQLTLTLLPSGLVLAVGGTGPEIDECPLVSEIYNPTIDQWTSIHLLNSIRYDHVTILINDSVLAIGGSAELFFQLNQCERLYL